MSYLSPRITHEILDCSMPVTFDTYSNCSFQCRYCFSQYQRGRGAQAEKYVGRKCESVNVEKVKRIFLNPEGTEFEPWIKNKKVIQWGGLSDQFDGFEKRYGKTLELMRFFKEIKYPISFSTKSTWFLKDSRYLEVIDGTQDFWHWKFSIITLDELKAKVIECGVPTPMERLEAIRLLASMGHCVTLRLRPFIIGVSNPSFEELINISADYGAYSVSTEFFCLDTRAGEISKKQFELIGKCCGFDLVDFYKKNSSGHGYLRLCHRVKEPFMKKISDICNKRGLRLGVSDAHCKSYGTLGSCCGLPDDWNYFRGQLTEAIYRCKKNGTDCISFADIQPDVDYYSHLKARNTVKMIGRSMVAKFSKFNLSEYIKYFWNNSKCGNSPCNYMRGSATATRVNEQGNIEYKIIKRGHGF